LTRVRKTMKIAQSSFFTLLSAALPAAVKQAEEAGDLKRAYGLIVRLLSKPLPAVLAGRLEYEKEKLRRIRKAYPYGREAALKVLKDKLSDLKAGELKAWINSGLITPKFIDGKERFFSDFSDNLLFLDAGLKKRLKKPNKARAAVQRYKNRRLDELLRGAAPAKYRIRARISLELRSPPREKVRCWLPFPRVADQVSAARLVAASHKNYRLSGAKAPQRTIYFEGKDRKFFAEFEYSISECVLKPPRGRGHNSIPPAASRYLREEPPHIVFTPYVKKLAAQIVGREKDNYRKAGKIYDWLTRNLAYTFVLPYDLLENISEYGLQGRRGDCGVQVLAFITLCRAAGVPAKWQSGWNICPGRVNPHDWAMFYCGRWRYADISVGASHRSEARRGFYFGNLDAWRMPANSEFGADLSPEKRHWRSDPVDNQVGEAETRSRNIYFDGFRRKLELLSFKKIA